MKTTVSNKSKVEPQSPESIWFNQLVNDIRVDEQLLANDLMPESKKKMYDDMISGNVDEVVKSINETASKFYITNLLRDYISELITYEANYKQMGLELSNKKILVWAELFDDDFASEKKFILAQAKVNAKYCDFGFSVSSTIIEESDELIIPNHYKLIPTRK